MTTEEYAVKFIQTAYTKKGKFEKGDTAYFLLDEALEIIVKRLGFFVDTEDWRGAINRAIYK